ncbi:MAG: hypothetical protein QXW35_05690 [Candidatus Aenigmatarchaeota archaeon]
MTIILESKLKLTDEIGQDYNCLGIDKNINSITDFEIFNYAISTFTLNPKLYSVLVLNVYQLRNEHKEQVTNKLLSDLAIFPEEYEMFKELIKIKDLVFGIAYNKYHLIYPLSYCKHTPVLILNSLPNMLDIVSVELAQDNGNHIKGKSKNMEEEPPIEKTQIELVINKFKQALKIAYYNYHTENIYEKVKNDVEYYITHKRLFDYILFDRENLQVEDKIYQQALLTYLLSPSVSSTKITEKKIKSMLDLSDVKPLPHKTWTEIISYLYFNGYKYNIFQIKSYLYKQSYFLPQLLSNIKGIITLYISTKENINPLSAKAFYNIIKDFKFENYM